MFHTFDAKGSVFGVVCLIASVEVQRSCRGFHTGLFFQDINRDAMQFMTSTLLLVPDVYETTFCIFPGLVAGQERMG